jgi:hypothetical protein
VGEDGAAVTMSAFKVADILNPIESCNPKSGNKEHTKYGMVYARGREPQEVAGRVLLTYDVIWRENTDSSET